MNYILCDDNMKDRERIVGYIDNFMMRNDIDYHKHLFSDYNDKFLEIICKKMPGKIYILDIETPSRSGIDIARIIRRRDDDSIIIFLTGHEELGQVVLKKHFQFLSFINKFDNCKEDLEETLELAIKKLEKKQTIRFQEGGSTIKLKSDDILYISKNGDRKTVIKTDCNEFKISMPLSKVIKMLPEEFIKTHKSCIVNKERILEYNKNKRIIKFDNGEAIDLIASRFKGELI